MKFEAVKLDKIPYLFKNTNLKKMVTISKEIPSLEGTFVAAKALKTEGKRSEMDFIQGRLGKIVEGDIIAGILGSRQALVEFAGFVPPQIIAGDQLYLLCESGLIGQLSGKYPFWGIPVKVELIGSIVNDRGNTLNLRQFKVIKRIKAGFNKLSIPLIVLTATRMDCGKTTMACKLIHYFSKKGKKVAAIKATGVAFSQDIYQMKDYGAVLAVDFVDVGLPSTCNMAADEVVQSYLSLLNHVKKKSPDLIITEFGDGLIGKYGVLEILRDIRVKRQISFLILAAYDFCSLYGAKTILDDIGLQIDLVTGPLANSQLGISLVKQYFSLFAESNQSQIPTTIELIGKLF